MQPVVTSCGVVCTCALYKPGLSSEFVPCTIGQHTFSDKGVGIVDSVDLKSLKLVVQILWSHTF